MHLLTIPQPYAQQLVTGQLWLVSMRDSTDYRGPVAIHAGMSEKYQTRHESRQAGMPIGAIIGYGMLTLCTTPYWIRRQGSSIALVNDNGRKVHTCDTSLHPSDFTWSQLLRHMNDLETVRQHGRARRLPSEYSQTHPYRWVIECPMQLKKPIPFKAKAQFSELDTAIERMLDRKPAKAANSGVLEQH